MFLEFLLLFLAIDLNIYSSSNTAMMKKESRKEETIIHIYIHSHLCLPEETISGAKRFSSHT